MAKAWENCVEEVKNTLGNSKELGEIDWNTVSQDSLDNNTFKLGNPFFLICPDRHCTDFQNISLPAHRLCSCTDMNGNKIPDCTPASYLYPYLASICFDTDSRKYNLKSGRSCTRQGDNWYELSCYCCCSCFANGTKIGVPDGLKAIENFAVGDKVLTASLVRNGTNVGLNWSSTKVTFSSGTGKDGHQAAMVYIHYGNNGSIVVTPDHLFLLPSGKIVRADRLAPGAFQLLSDGGEAVDIHEVSIGEYEGGVHHIATGAEFEGSLDGHLLLSEGVVSCDFSVQIHAGELKDTCFVDDHDDLPKIGTPEYERKYAHLESDHYATFKSPAQARLLAAAAAGGGAAAVAAASPMPRKFYVHGKNVAEIPASAAKYLSAAQQAELSDAADKLGFTEVGVGNTVVKYVLRLFQGFFPNINFFHDIGRLEPNAYAFSQFGQQTIVLTGGLTRIKGLGLEGYSLILSHMISRLQATEPLADNGYTTVGMADYYSTNNLRTVYFMMMYQPVYSNGMKQLEELIFKRLATNAQYEEDPFAPDWETRLDAIIAGDKMVYPPDGIGGPTMGGLAVTGASVQPPVITAAALVTEDIRAAMAVQAIADLTANGVLDEDGVLSADFTVDSDLSFLFADEASAGFRKLLIEEVRYSLLHSGSTVTLSFNMPLSANTAADIADYTIEPAAKILSVSVEPEASEVAIGVHLERGTAYTVTASAHVRAQDSSTIDFDNNSATVTLA